MTQWQDLFNEIPLVKHDHSLPLLVTCPARCIRCLTGCYYGVYEFFKWALGGRRLEHWVRQENERYQAFLLRVMVNLFKSPVYYRTGLFESWRERE